MLQHNSSLFINEIADVEPKLSERKLWAQPSEKRSIKNLSLDYSFANAHHDKGLNVFSGYTGVINLKIVTKKGFYCQSEETVSGIMTMRDIENMVYCVS